jgi:HlyD family secretion protein
VTRRATLALVAIAAVVLAVSAALPALRGIGSVDVRVPTYEVARGDFVRRVHAEGNLAAVDATLLGPPPEVSRPLKIAWLAPDGTPVSAGDVVIRFDPTELERELQDGRYDRATADSRIDGRTVREEGSLRNLERDAELAGVELDYARSFQSKDEQIFSRNEIIEAEIDQELATQKRDHAETTGRIQGELGQTELDLLGIERRKADLKVEQAAQGLEALEVRAPHDGIFVLKRVWGRKPEVGRMVWGGNAVAELPKLEAMEAKVYVLEADAGGLEVGIPGSVVLDAYPDTTYSVKVKHADALAQRRNRQSPVQYFQVTLELERTDPVMKPGQRVQAKLILDERAGVLTVPPQAVFEDDGEKVVYVRRGGDFESQEVELGPAGLGRVVIESGLREGDLVALRDPKRAPDDPVTGREGGSGPVSR